MTTSSGFAGRSDREIVEMAVAEEAGGDAALVELTSSRSAAVATGQLVEAALADRGRPRVELRLSCSRAGVPLAIVTGAQRLDVDFVLEAAGSHERLLGASSRRRTSSTASPIPRVSCARPRSSGSRRSTSWSSKTPSSGCARRTAAGDGLHRLVGTKSRQRARGRADAVVVELARPRSCFDEALGALTRIELTRQRRGDRQSGSAAGPPTPVEARS